MENVSQTKIYSLRVPVVGQPEKKADEGEKEVMEDDIEIEGKNKSYRLWIWIPLHYPKPPPGEL